MKSGAATLEVTFDSFDCDGTTVVWTKPKSHDPRDPGPTQISLKNVIPFCPKKVGVHLEFNQGAVFAQVKGILSHACAPEAEEMVPAGVLLL